MVIFGGIMVLTILNAIGWMASGRRQMGIGGIIGCTMMLSWICWYLNLFEVFRQLSRPDPESYESMTGAIGYIM